MAGGEKGEGLQTHALRLLATLQDKCLRRITGASKRTPVAALKNDAGILLLCSMLCRASSPSSCPWTHRVSGPILGPTTYHVPNHAALTRAEKEGRQDLDTCRGNAGFYALFSGHTGQSCLN